MVNDGMFCILFKLVGANAPYFIILPQSLTDDLVHKLF